jgi:hypothetical protein
VASAGAAGDARIAVPRSVDAVYWTGGPKDTYSLRGQVLLGGRPVAHVGVRVNGFELTPTNRAGTFTYPADANDPKRFVFSVFDASRATVAGRSLTDAERAQVRAASPAAFTVAYGIRDLELRPLPNGNLAVSGRIAFGNARPPLTIALFGYRIVGRIVDANGDPVAHAVVATQTPDEQQWAFSGESDARGNYVSYFWPSGNAPVQLRVAQGERVWEAASVIKIPKYRSARVDIGLPPPDFAMAPPTVRAIPGAVYEGILVGAEVDGKPIVPVSATWPDGKGKFRLVLPRSARGKQVSFYEDQGNFFLTKAPVGGGPVPRQAWPKRLDATVPQGLAARVAR